MDPNAAWKLLLEALVRRDTGTAREMVGSLRRWLANGGFPPYGMERVEAIVLMNVIVRGLP